jgi:iron complex outermembrane recepter protein
MRFLRGKQTVEAIVLGFLSMGPAAPVAFAQLEEIVVTAERREANVQDTAAAITAVSGDELGRLGVVHAEEMIKTAPSLHVTTAGANQIQAYVRGVGNFAANTFAEGAVAFNVDGVYISRATTLGGLFFDLARVEVLKGPQGTLYGRNATGGAINLISRRPEPGGDFSGYVNGEYGNYDRLTVNGAVNLPVSDTFALRGAFQVLDGDGYFDDGTSDAGSQSLRLSGLFAPSDGFSLLLVGDYENVDDTGAGGTISGPNPPFVPGDFLSSDPWSAGALSPEVNALLTLFGRAPLGTPAPFDKVETFGLTAELNWDLGFATLTALPAYRDSDNRNINYSPGFLIDVDESAKQTSVEVRLASNGSQRLAWVAGVYYFDESIESDSYFLQQLTIPGTFPGENSTRLNPDLDTEAWAAFGQVTASLTERLRLVAGVRYTSEDKTMSGVNSTNPPFDPLGPNPVVFPIEGDESWDKTTWKVGIEFDAADQNLLYFNVSTGFKAGGFYAEQAQYGNSFDPEELTAYALGSKNRFLDNRMQLNAEAFYWDYKDHQESHLALSPGFYSIFQTENVGQADIYGIEFDGMFLLTEDDVLSLQAQYLNAEFKEFSYNAFSPAGPPLVGCPTMNVGGSFFTVDCDGFDAIRAPQWSAIVGYQHTFKLNSGGHIQFDLRSQISDSTYVSIEYLPSQVADSYTMTDVNLTWYSAGDTWSVGLWGRNLEDSEVMTNSFTSPFTPIQYSQLRPPRTYGISFGFVF